jgi:hypothetical protein
MIWEIISQYGHPKVEVVDAHFIHLMRLQEEGCWRLVTNEVTSPRGPTRWAPVGPVRVREFVLSNHCGAAIIAVNFPMMCVTRGTQQLDQSWRRGHVHLDSVTAIGRLPSTTSHGRSAPSFRGGAMDAVVAPLIAEQGGRAHCTPSKWASAPDNLRRADAIQLFSPSTTDDLKALFLDVYPHHRGVLATCRPTVMGELNN